MVYCKFPYIKYFNLKPLMVRINRLDCNCTYSSSETRSKSPLICMVTLQTNKHWQTLLVWIACRQPHTDICTWNLIYYMVYHVYIQYFMLTSYMESNTFSNIPNKICWDDNETPACIVHNTYFFFTHYNGKLLWENRNERWRQNAFAEHITHIITISPSNTHKLSRECMWKLLSQT